MSKKFETFDLKEFSKIIFKEYLTVCGFVFLFILLGLIHSYSSQEMYESDATLIIQDASSGPEEGLSSFSGLVGLQVGGSSKAEMAVEAAKSKDFIKRFVNKNKLEYIFAMNSWSKESGPTYVNGFDIETNGWKGQLSNKRIYNKLWKDLSFNIKQGTSFAYINYYHVSPEVAETVITLFIKDINSEIAKIDQERAKKKIEFISSQINATSISEVKRSLASLISMETRTLALTHVEEGYIFTVLDPPIVSLEKTKPNKTLIMIIYIMLGTLIGIIYVLLNKKEI